jgi:hypothetical protein
LSNSNTEKDDRGNAPRDGAEMTMKRSSIHYDVSAVLTDCDSDDEQQTRSKTDKKII